MRSFSGIRAQTIDAAGKLTDEFVENECANAINSHGEFRVHDLDGDR